MVNLPWGASIQQLQQLGPEVRLVVVHPNYIQQHVLLCHLIRDSQQVVYVRLPAGLADETAAWHCVQQGLQEQMGTDNPAAVQTLVLDECDRAETPVFCAFLADLAARASGRIYVISRILQFDDTLRNAFNGQARFLPADDRLMLFDYARRDASRPLLEVRAFGSGRVLVDGRPVDSWDGSLPRSLFFYFIDRGMATRSDIFETFWPRLSAREATNVFHVTKRKINEVLGVDLTAYGSGFYRISPDIDLSYDAVNFATMVNNSAIADSDDEAMDLLENALLLYRGKFLTALDLDWVQQRREELHQVCTDALDSLARLKHEHGQPEAALGLYARAVSAAPQEEELVTRMMELYIELGKPADALQVYHRHKLELEEKLATEPSQRLQTRASELRSLLR